MSLGSTKCIPLTSGLSGSGTPHTFDAIGIVCSNIDSMGTYGRGSLYIDRE